MGGTEKMFPKWTTPPDRNSAEWMKGFGENPRMAVVDKIASDLSYVRESCTGSTRMENGRK